MTLRHKTLLAVGSTLLGLLLLLYAATARIWLAGFDRVEIEDSRQNVRRVADALSERIIKIDQAAEDYASWDDTCQYIQDGNKAYESSNLVSGSWANLELNCAIYVDIQGRPRFSTGYDIRGRRVIPLAPGVLEACRQKGVFQFDTPKQQHSGILLLPPSPTPATKKGKIVLSSADWRVLLFSSRPIISSDRKGPIRGAVFFARYLDERELGRIALLTHFDLSLNTLDETLAPDMEKARDLLLRRFYADAENARLIKGARFDPALIEVRPLDEDTLSGYCLAQDISGRPVLLLRVDAPRTVYGEGRNASRYFLVSLLVASIIFGAVPLFIVEKLVLRRLSHLSSEVASVGRAADFSAARVAVQGRDELSDLATGINGMLDALGQTQHLLRDSEELYREMTQLALSASDAIFVAQMNVENHPLTWQGQAEAMLSLEGGAVPQTLESWLALVHDQDRAAVRRAILTACETGESFQRECRVRADEYFYRHWFTRGKPLRDASGKIVKFIGACTDVTERKVLEDRLAYQAFHDPLTNLPNRVLFSDRLEQAVVRAERSGDAVAVLFVDLDNFKVVNDSLGHSVGDALLIGVANRLHASLRAGDTACRFGGDEFAIILDRAGDNASALQIAERIVQGLQNSFDLGGRDVFVTASVGIAVGDGSQSADELLSRADVAMYEAKKKGKDRLAVFTSDMSDLAMRRLEMESDLRRAMERAELALCYQPIVDLRSDRVVAFEALLRWIHPQRGMVSPLDFIPLAEETGQIVPIGQWVLEEACLQTRLWQEQFPAPPGEAPLRVSVNLSVRQLQTAGFVDIVRGALQKSGLPASSLLLEITESIFMEEGEPAVSLFQSLKAMGVRLAIDDFGTGYSSLAYLKAFPLDYLKIDRKFVSGLDNGLLDRPLESYADSYTADSYVGETAGQAMSELETRGGDAAILSSVIGLAHTLRLIVVAEGAEEVGEVERLLELGCDLAQGYYYARPMPAALVENYLQSGNLRLLA